MKYRVVILDRFNKEFDTLRSNVDLKEAKQIQKDSLRIIGKKTKILPMTKRAVV